MLKSSNLARYERIAPFYDLLDLPFERRRYRTLRPLMFQNLGGHLLDAGVGTGRNCAFYPPGAIVFDSTHRSEARLMFIAAFQVPTRPVVPNDWS